MAEKYSVLWPHPHSRQHMENGASKHVDKEFFMFPQQLTPASEECDHAANILPQAHMILKSDIPRI